MSGKSKQLRIAGDASLTIEQTERENRNTIHIDMNKEDDMLSY